MKLGNFWSTISFIFTIFVFTEVYSDINDPFSVTVTVEEGANINNWENGIFKNIPKSQKSKEESEKEDKNKEKKHVKTKPAEINKTEKEINSVSNETKKSELPEPKKKSFSESEPLKEYNFINSKWGSYYGENVSVKDKTVEPEQIVKQETEPFMFPIDLLLWSHGGDGYNPILNTGIKISYWNLYSIISVGTDFSIAAYRPLFIGMSAGGFYDIDDFSITADLGYEKAWDFGGNGEVNDYALGLRAGLNYSVLSWFAISAGAGVNYSVFKDSQFEEGKFIPMFFGGFQFNLIK